MTEKQVLLVKLSWSYLSNQIEDFAVFALKRVSRQFPDVAVNDINITKLTTWFHSISHFVASLPDFQRAEKKMFILLGELSEEHHLKNNYDQARALFLETLEKRLAEKWNDEINEAWNDVFNAMREYLRERLQPAPLKKSNYQNNL